MNEAVARSLTAADIQEFGFSLINGIRNGAFEVRLAGSPTEIRKAQELRYRIFYGEMGAKPTPEMVACGRDFDKFDEHCDHLLVLRHDEDQEEPIIIGTYRLMRREAAKRSGGFYSAGEFDISRIEAVNGEILEVGRACVDAEHRNRPTTMQLLWRGISTYAVYHGAKIMFGCASLPGTDPQKLARPLSYLHYNHVAPEQIRARALPDRYIRMDQLPPDEIDTEAAVAELDRRASMSALPPLIKGYLRLGGYIGDGAVLDPEFQTIDVCIIVVTDLMAQKYFKHYIRTTG